MSAGRRGQRPGPEAHMPLPPKSPSEAALERELLGRMNAVVDGLFQRNLENGVLLAQMAARREGELVEHFAELGRRFAHLVDEPKFVRAKRGVAAIEGDKS